MTHVFRVASLIFNQPLLVDPAAALTLVSGLSDRLGIDDLTALQTAVPEASRFVGKPSGPRGDDGRTIEMFREQDGIAIISLFGELVNRGAWIGASSGLTSYEGFDAQLKAAEDPRIRGVILDMNTPGGQASGAMESAARVRALAAKKPVYAFVNGMAASAGYAIASGASKIVTTPSGILGSIGVVWMHLDKSAQIEKAGMKPTLLTAGAYKADGHPLSALPSDARARIQASIDQVYGLFVDTVAAHRPLDAKAVRATEAGTFMGRAAVDAGLADAVGTLDDVFAMMSADLAASQSSPRNPFLTHASSQKGLNHMTDAASTQAQIDAAVATARTEAHAAGHAVGLAEGHATGATAERERISAILDGDHAKGRTALASHFAFKTNMPAEAALAALEASPVAHASGVSALATAMAQTSTPRLGPGGEGQVQTNMQPRSLDAASIYDRRRASASGK